MLAALEKIESISSLEKICLLSGIAIAIAIVTDLYSRAKSRQFLYSGELGAQSHAVVFLCRGSLCSAVEVTFKLSRIPAITQRKNYHTLHYPQLIIRWKIYPTLLLPHTACSLL